MKRPLRSQSKSNYSFIKALQSYIDYLESLELIEPIIESKRLGEEVLPEVHKTLNLHAVLWGNVLRHVGDQESCMNFMMSIPDKYEDDRKLVLVKNIVDRIVFKGPETEWLLEKPMQDIKYKSRWIVCCNEVMFRYLQKNLI